MPIYTDQAGHRIELSKVPKRIISIVPSQTELLFELGLDEEVVGITKFCVHPTQWFRNKTRVGGTKQLNMEIIHQLQPDLIIANKEENTKEQVEELMKIYPVWTSDIATLDDAMMMITSIGQITGKPGEAATINERIITGFDSLVPLNADTKAVYLIWQKPYMAAGGDTFISNMMSYAGLNNIYADSPRYPETSIEELKEKKVSHVLLSSEPFPFTETHLEEISKHLPEAKVMLVDGEMFSWYGSRLVETSGYLKELMKSIALKLDS